MNIIIATLNRLSNLNWQTVFALVSLIVSGLNFYYSNLRKAKIKGILSVDEISFDFKNKIIAPKLILQNIGTQTAVIENIRLKFIFGKCKFYAEPQKFFGLILSQYQIWENKFNFRIDVTECKNGDFLNFKSNSSNKIGLVTVDIKFLNKKGYKKILINKKTPCFGWIIEKILPS